MNESSPHVFSREFKKRRFKLPRLKSNKRRTLIGLGVVGVVVLAIAGYGIYEYLKPVYVIGGTKISREDISQYAKAIDEYKAANKDVNFGGDSKQVAVDDLVMNAALVNEMQERKDDFYATARKTLSKRYEAKEASPQVKKMLQARGENELFRTHMKNDLIAVKDILVVYTPLDSPLYLDKKPEEIKRLRQEAYDRLNKDFLPLMDSGLSKDAIGKQADVAAYDASKKAQNENWEQYTQKNVVVADFRASVLPDQKAFNEQDITDYYGVPVADLQSTSEKVAALEKTGQTTGLFASKSGSYMIVRLEKTAGGPYGSWESFVNKYKKKYVNSRFAYLAAPSKGTIMQFGNRVSEAFTTPGLQKAKAQVPGGCNSHLVTFALQSVDADAWANIGGTSVSWFRASHTCGSAWTGTKNFTTPAGGAYRLLDNCYGNQPTWNITGHPAGYDFLGTVTTEGLFVNPYAGFPQWTPSRINGVGDIYIDFHYRARVPPVFKASNLDFANCNGIVGWIFDSRAWNWQPAVTIWVDGRPGQGGKAWNIGTANVYRPDVGAAYPGIPWERNNHGFSVDPRNAPLNIDFFDGNNHPIYLVASALSDGSQYEFASANIRCPSPPPTEASKQPSASANLGPDNEEPSQATFTSRITQTGTPYAATFSREYYVVRRGSASKEMIATAKFAPALSANPFSGSTTSNWGPENAVVTDVLQAAKLNLKTGDKVCAEVTVSPARVRVNYRGIIVSTLEASRTTGAECDVMTDKPYVSFLGNDVYAGGAFVSGGACTSVSGMDIRAFSKVSGTQVLGSGTQLAAGAMAAIDGFSSGVGNSGASQTRLTFANNGGGYGGNFGQSRCIPDYYSQAPGSPNVVGAVSPPAAGSNTQHVRPTGSFVRVNGATNLSGKAAIYVDGDVVIDNNIQFASTNWADRDSVPSFYLVVRGNIYISSGVSRLDGVYVAQPNGPNGGVIYTCTKSDGVRYTAAELGSNCNSQLTVNGNFVSKQTRLLRTKGSMRDGRSNYTGNAAEVFRFSPETYVGTPAIPPVTGGSSEKTQSYTTLPPVL